jgi:hypothetical protein
LATLTSSVGFGAASVRKLIFELDPVAPASAAYDKTTNDISTAKWGANVDFNVGGVLSTGPEIWSATYYLKGTDPEARREDLQLGERHKLGATRLRWNLTFWEVPSAMRGWYVQGAWNYLKVESKANRITEGGIGDAVADVPDDETDLITDERHGATFGFGNRWQFFGQDLTVTVGASITSMIKRNVSVDSRDPYAREDYEDLIETLPDSKLTIRPLPEARLSIGYAF